MTSDLPVPEPLMLIDGRLVVAAHGAAYAVIDPTTGATVAHAPDASAEDMDEAITAARRAADDPAWTGDAALRQRCVRQLYDAVADHADVLKVLLTLEAGMPVAATDAQLPALDDTLPEAAPAGVLAVITPFTDPLRIALERIGPALLAGQTVVLKPAPDVAWAACELGRLAVEHTDLPPGVLNVVPTRDVDVAIGLTTDPRVDAVSFTGSAVVAARVEHQAAGKALTLEAGGARTVRASGDGLADAVRDAARAVAAHAGQACGVPTRILVPADRLDEAAEVAVEAMAAHAPGDPADPGTVCGPLISAVQRDRVRRYLGLAEQEGGKVLVGGGVPADRDAGFWVEPAVVTGLAPDARAAVEEILGPVLILIGEEAR